MPKEFAQSFELKSGGYLLVDRHGNLWELLPISKVGPQSSPEPATATQPFKTKRGPGRPTNAERQARRLAEAQTPAFAQAVVEAQEASEPKFEKCQYCGRDLPSEVIPIHEENCRAAAIGYATHIAQPGDKS